jgi:hypothetical protein
MAAFMSLRDPFPAPDGPPEEANSRYERLLRGTAAPHFSSADPPRGDASRYQRLLLGGTTQSDHLVLVRAYDVSARQ